MMKKMLGLGAMVVCFPFTVNAAQMYVGASYGKTEVDFSDQYQAAIEASGASLDDSDNGVKLLLGSRLTPYLAVEGFYADLGDVSITNQGTTLSMEAMALGVTVIGYYPISVNVDLFGRLGFHFWDIDAATSRGYSASNDGTDFVYGIGTAYNMGQISLHAEYEKFMLKDDEIDMLSVGFVYRY